MVPSNWFVANVRDAFAVMFFVLVAILAIDFLLGFADALTRIKEQPFQWGSLLQEMPVHARTLLAESCLIGAIWYMGGRAQHGELNALRSLGISSWKICLAAAVPAFALALLVLLLAEWGGQKQRAGEQQVRQWVPVQNRLLLNEECGLPLHWWDLAADGVRSWGVADTACYRDGTWHLRDVKQWRQGREAPEMVESMTLSAPAAVPALQRKNAVVMRFSDLWRAYRTPGLLASQRGEALALEFWRRLLAPLQIALLVLLATLLPLAMLRDARPGIRLVAALGMAFAFHLSETVLLTSGRALALPPWGTAAIAPLCLALLYWFLLRRFS